MEKAAPYIPGEYRGADPIGGGPGSLSGGGGDAIWGEIASPFVGAANWVAGAVDDAGNWIAGAASDAWGGIEDAAKFVGRHPLSFLEIAGGAVLMATGIGTAPGIALIASGAGGIAKGAIEDANKGDAQAAQQTYWDVVKADLEKVWAWLMGLFAPASSSAEEGAGT